MAKGANNKNQEPDQDVVPDEAEEGGAEKLFTTLRVRRETGLVITGTAAKLLTSVDKLFERPDVQRFFLHLAIAANKEEAERLQLAANSLGSGDGPEAGAHQPPKKPRK